MGRAIDITGRRFGRLVALRMTGHSQSGNALWLCQCDCGNQIVTDSNHLRHGLVRSCGCLRRERSRENILTNLKTLVRMKFGSPTPYDPEKPIRMNSRNVSGVTGVSWDAVANRWFARLMVGGKLVLNKAFATFGDAVAARRAAEASYHVAPRKPRH